MSISQIIALVRDVVILAALGFIVWFVYHAGKNADLVADMKALQKALDAQQTTLSNWRSQSDAASQKLQDSVAAINSAPPIQHQWVCKWPGNPTTVLPGSPSPTVGSHPPTGTTESGSGATLEPDRRDLAVQEFKRKWETTLAGCRVLWDSWPNAH